RAHFEVERFQEPWARQIPARVRRRLRRAWPSLPPPDARPASPKRSPAETGLSVPHPRAERIDNRQRPSTRRRSPARKRSSSVGLAQSADEVPRAPAPFLVSSGDESWLGGNLPPPGPMELFRR